MFRTLVYRTKRPSAAKFAGESLFSNIPDSAAEIVSSKEQKYLTVKHFQNNEIIPITANNILKVLGEEHAKEIARWKHEVIKTQVITSKMILKLRFLKEMNEKKLSRNYLYSSARRLAVLEAVKNQEIFQRADVANLSAVKNQMKFLPFGRVRIPDTEHWLVSLRNSNIITPSETSVIWRLSQCVEHGMAPTLRANSAMNEHLQCLSIENGGENKSKKSVPKIILPSIDDLYHSSLTSKQNAVLKCSWECINMKLFQAKKIRTRVVRSGTQVESDDDDNDIDH